MRISALIGIGHPLSTTLGVRVILCSQQTRNWRTTFAHMRKLFPLAFGLLATLATAQNSQAQHRIAFHCTTADSTEHKGLMRNIKNALTAAPDARIEVVCHGPGLDMLMIDRSVVKEKVTEFAAKGVVFDACLNTIAERKIDKANVLPAATYVPSGVIRVVELQEKGWSYIKAGF